MPKRPSYVRTKTSIREGDRLILELRNGKMVDQIKIVETSIQNHIFFHFDCKNCLWQCEVLKEVKSKTYTTYTSTN